MKNGTLTINIEIDVDAIGDAINNATSLNDNDQVFAALASYVLPKKQLEDALDKIASIEAAAKGIIKARAEALYGAEWDAIKGHGYKVSRQPTGAVFEVTGKPKKEFVITKVSVDSKKVVDYVKANGKMPAGIELNKNRGDSLRVKVDENPEA